jgi:catechol 2,3-dioxygenase-like lactoylglutathione lyase family enzyme
MASCGHVRSDPPLRKPSAGSRKPISNGRWEKAMDEFVKGLVWVGTRTEHYKKMVAFYRDTLRLSLDYEEGEFAIFKLADGSKAEVFGPSDTEHTHFSTGPIVGFLVDDVKSARKRLEAVGIEFIGPVHEWEPTGEAWSHFRAPDGNVYEIVQGPKR